MRSHSRVPVVTLVVALSLLPLGAAPGLAQDGSAPGAPIFDCSNAAARYVRMHSGLGVMEDAMRRTQAQLDALEEMKAAGTKEARDALVSRSVDTLESHATDEIEALMVLRQEALGLTGEAAEAAARRTWAGKILALKGEIEDLQKLAQAFKAGQDYGKELQSRSHSVIEHLKEANKLFVDSGLAEEIGGDLASLGGPLGVAAFEGALFLIDYAAADMDGFSRELERRDLEEALSNMNHAYGEVKLKMADLQENCPNQFGRNAETPSRTASTSLTPPLADPPAPPPAQPEVSAQKKKGGMSGGQAAMVVLGAGALAGAAVYAGSVMGELAGGSCYSSRFCIVSVMGHGCDCAGSTNAGCDWTGPTAGPNEGCGSGTPCASNLSCNNGRCEGPDGRCRF